MSFRLVSLLLLGLLATATEPPHPELHRKLRDIAASYQMAQLINPRPMPAPVLCASGSETVPPVIRASKATPKSAHGGKLFYLFAKQARSLRDPSKGQAVGQYLVKEAWESVGATASRSPLTVQHASGQWVENSTVVKGKLLTTGKALDLFIMLKEKPNTTNTDSGWIYAVVSRDGKTIREAGPIQSCINCHEDARNDRILGDYRSPGSIIIPEPPKK
jgi:hypothetical protein